MAIVGSGTVALSDIQTEFGGSNPISLSEYYRGGAYTTANNTGVPTSGEISISDFYGAVADVSGTQEYTTAGSYNWTVPAGVTSVTVTTTGGAGGGASGYYTYNSKFATYTPQFGGDGGTATADVDTFAVTAGNTVAVVVGSGGSGGSAPGTTATSPNNGSSGGTSTVTYLAVLRSSSSGGPGGTTSDSGNGLGGNGGYNNGAGTAGVSGSVRIDYS